MPAILDQSGDTNGQRLYRLSQLHGFPEYVKEASVDTSERLPIQCYADPGHRQFPMHTKAATWLSYAYLCDAQGGLPMERYTEIAKRLKQAADHHGNREDLDQIDSVITKSAAAPIETDYALVTNSNGQSLRALPLRGSEDVFKAAAYLRQHLDTLPLELRQTMATQILKKAESCGADFPEEDRSFLDKQAGNGWCAAADAASLLRDRATVLRKRAPELASSLDTAADACLKQASVVRDPARLRTLAVHLDAIDRDFGLTDYGEVHQRPEDILFAVSKQEVEKFAATHCVASSGSVYALADLAKIAVAQLAEVFGDDFTDSVSAGGLQVIPEKLAEAIDKMSGPDAALMDRLLAESGISPSFQEPGSDGSWLTPDVLEHLAR